MKVMEDGVQNNMPENMAPAPAEHGNGVKQAVIGLVVVAVLLALGFWLFNIVGTSTEEVSPGLIKTTAREGQVVAGFPSELLVEEGVAISESYTISYVDNDMTQPVVRYTSDFDLADNVSFYRSFFNNTEGWSIRRDADPEASSNVTSIYAIGTEGDANVTFVGKEAGAVEVSVAYVAK